MEAQLADRGYRVLAPDLRGHGRSGRAASYRPEEFADDLVETLPQGADLAIGHSLGGLALSLAVHRLRPARAVYYEPAFVLPVIPPEARKYAHAYIDDATADSIKMWWPRWSDADVAADLHSFGLFDRAVMTQLTELGGQSYLPESAVVPSLVVLGDQPSSVVTPEVASTLRERGFQTVTVADTGHCIHRDDLAGFLAALESWI